MNRIIKFRGKRIDNSEWVYGDLIQYESGEISIFSKKLSKYGYEATEMYKRDRVIPETIGQYTGLTDKNSKEIYEGDRIKTSGDNIFTIEFIGSGYFCKREDGLIISLDGINRTIEVIGTIFDKED